MRKPNYDEAVKITDKIYNTTDFTKEQLQPLNDYLDFSLSLEDKHEALVKDVARYFKLVEKTMSYVILGREDECYEVKRLKDKLSKVGKE